MSKYWSLAKYLSETAASEVVLSFSKIEEILGFSLPSSARKLYMWWGNDETHSQAKAGWLAAGYVVERVDFKNEIVRFRKARPPAKEERYSEHCIKMKLVKELEKIYGELLTDVRLGGRVFDFSSPDSSVVGELLVIRNGRTPTSYFINISGHLWYLEKVDAPIKFIVFYGDRKVPEAWLSRFRHLVKGIKFYFLNEDRIEGL